MLLFRIGDVMLTNRKSGNRNASVLSRLGVVVSETEWPGNVPVLEIQRLATANMAACAERRAGL